MDHIQMKEMIAAALSQLDATGSPPEFDELLGE